LTSYEGYRMQGSSTVGNVEKTLVVDTVSIRRGDRLVITELSCEAGPGEIVGIVGRNGCGKSTLLMAIAGVLAPRDGQISISGASVWGSPKARLRARRALGYVPEAADPPGFLRGGELWALVAATRGCASPSNDLGAALGLEELRDTSIERMSLGQRRRACLGAAFMGPPDLLVLDEPDNGLDARRLEALLALLKAHASGGRTVVMASHDAGLLEQLGARIIALT
jgi:ABC-type multidrug transport system ATPase subunit